MIIDDVIFNECKKTFMEQMKIHKRETAFAAILAYYFKPHEDHGLDDLFLKALFKKIDSENNFEWNKEKISVKLEQPTSKGRIDILIYNSQFVICIEFKIDHQLNNPLQDYVEYVNKKFYEIKNSNKHFVILTPFKKDAKGDAKQNSNFKEIILSEFFEEIGKEFKSRKSHYEDNPKLQFYEDLVQTVKNRKIRSERYNKLNEIRVGLLNESPKCEFHNTNQGGFIEIKNEKLNFATKLRMSHEGWQFEKYIENKKVYTLKFNDKSDLDTTEKIAKKLLEFHNMNAVISS